MANKDELNPKVAALSLAGVSAILSLACAFLLVIARETTLKFFGSIFHGIDLAKIETDVTASGVITGLIAIVVIALVSGWLFAVMYNYLLKKQRKN